MTGKQMDNKKSGERKYRNMKKGASVLVGNSSLNFRVILRRTESSEKRVLGQERFFAVLLPIRVL